MFTGTPQAAIRLITELIQIGVRNFRLEALTETEDELRRKVQTYSRVISGSISAEQGYTDLGIVERYGVTEGQLLNIRSYRDRKKPSAPI